MSMEPDQERAMYTELQERSTGRFQYHTIEVVNGAPITRNDNMVRETAKRLIDEVVELCLDSGLQATEILAGVTDALHNEARKTNGQFYPSQLGYRQPDRDNMIVEITDVDICLDTLRYAASISSAKINEHRVTKLELLRRRAHDGVYKMVGLRMYKREART